MVVSLSFGVEKASHATQMERRNGDLLRSPQLYNCGLGMNPWDPRKGMVREGYCNSLIPIECCFFNPRDAQLGEP